MESVKLFYLPHCTTGLTSYEVVKMEKPSGLSVLLRKVCRFLAK